MSAVVVRVDNSLLRSMGAPIPVGIGAQMQVWVRSKEPATVLQVSVRYRCQEKRYSSLKLATMTDNFGVVVFDLAEGCTVNMGDVSLTIDPHRSVSVSTFTTVAAGLLSGSR